MLGVAGIVTPDATGGSLQFEKVPDDVIAGSSATSSSPAPEAKSGPVKPEEATSSSAGEAQDRALINRGREIGVKIDAAKRVASRKEGDRWIALYLAQILQDLRSAERTLAKMRAA